MVNGRLFDFNAAYFDPGLFKKKPIELSFDEIVAN